MQSLVRYESVWRMTKSGDEFGKFVRLNVVGEIVEVVGVNSTEITVKFFGHILTMKHHEVSPVSPEEEAAASERLKHADKASERVFIFQHDKGGGLNSG